MVRIRLARIGRKNDPYFRVVVQDSRKDTFGRRIEDVGSVEPRTKVVKLNAERIMYWLGKGAQPSDTVHNLLVSQGILKAPKCNVYHPKKGAVAAEETAASAAAKADGEASGAGASAAPDASTGEKGKSAPSQEAQEAKSPQGSETPAPSEELAAQEAAKEKNESKEAAADKSVKSAEDSQESAKQASSAKEVKPEK